MESIEHNRNAEEHIKYGLEARGQNPEVKLDRVKLEYRPENNEKQQHELFWCRVPNTVKGFGGACNVGFVVELKYNNKESDGSPTKEYKW